MWSIWFTMMFSGMLVSAMTENNKVWVAIFYVLMMICVVGQIIAKNKQKEIIENLEKQLKKMVGEDK